MKKLTLAQYYAACNHYWGSRQLQREQRFGQYLVNQLDLRTGDPQDTQEMFYTTNQSRVFELMQKFLEVA